MVLLRNLVAGAIMLIAPKYLGSICKSGASGRSRRLPVITRPPASYGTFLPRLEPGDSKSRKIEPAGILLHKQNNNA